jgi:hypothetical protein
MVDTVIRAENNLYFGAERTRTWSKKDKATDKVAATKEQQQKNHLTTGLDAQGTDYILGSHGSYCKLHGHNHSHGHGCDRGNSTQQGDHAGGSSGAALCSCKEMSQGCGSGAYHHCSQTGPFIAECLNKQWEGSAATPQQLGIAKTQ